MAKKPKKSNLNGKEPAAPFAPTYEALAALVDALPDPEPGPAVRRVFEQFRTWLARLRETGVREPEASTAPEANAFFAPTYEALAALVDALPDPEPSPAVRRVLDQFRARLSQTCNALSYSPLAGGANAGGGWLSATDLPAADNPAPNLPEGSRARRRERADLKQENRYCPHVESLEDRNATSFFGFASALATQVVSYAAGILSAMVAPVFQTTPPGTDGASAANFLTDTSHAPAYPSDAWDGCEGGHAWSPYGGAGIDLGPLDCAFAPGEGCFSWSLCGEM
jgi:hypothetical protein